MEIVQTGHGADPPADQRLRTLPFSRRTLRWICSAWNANSLRSGASVRPVDPRIPDLPGMCRVSCESNRDCAADAYCAEDGVCERIAASGCGL